MEKNGETYKNIPWRWIWTIAGAVIIFLVMFLPGIWEGKQREEEKKYLEKLQAEQQMAEAKNTRKKTEQQQKRNEEIDNPTTSLTNMEQEKNTERKETIIRVLISVDGTEQYFHSDVRISCPAPYLVKGDITVQQEAGHRTLFVRTDAAWADSYCGSTGHNVTDFEFCQKKSGRAGISGYSGSDERETRFSSDQPG